MKITQPKSCFKTSSFSLELSSAGSRCLLHLLLLGESVPLKVPARMKRDMLEEIPETSSLMRMRSSRQQVDHIGRLPPAAEEGPVGVEGEGPKEEFRVRREIQECPHNWKQ